MEIKRYGDHPNITDAVVHDSTIYLPVITAKEMSPSVTEQTKQILDQIDERLSMCGSSKFRMLRATVYCGDARFYEEINACWDAWVPWHDPPVCTFLVAKLAPRGSKVGIKVIVAQ